MILSPRQISGVGENVRAPFLFRITVCDNEGCVFPVLTDMKFFDYDI